MCKKLNLFVQRINRANRENKNNKSSLRPIGTYLSVGGQKQEM